MRKFVLTTKSDSGDDYIYFIKSDKKLSNTDLNKFLKECGNDVEDDFCYENIIHFEEIVDKEFIKYK